MGNIIILVKDLCNKQVIFEIYLKLIFILEFKNLKYNNDYFFD